MSIENPVDVSADPPIAEAPYLEAANWFVRVQQRSLSPSEWASFGNWFNFSKWNRLAFEQVARVWRGAPGSVALKRDVQPAAPARFAWHHADAWRDAVLPLAMTWYAPCAGGSEGGERQYALTRAAAAPAGLL